MRIQTVCAPMAFVTLILGTSGCTPGPLDEWAWPTPRTLGEDMDAVRPVRDPEAAAVDIDSYAQLTGTLTLRDVLAASLLRSPSLAAMGYEVRAREAEALQAGLLPNPELGFELENFGGNRSFKSFDALETTLSLSQLVELGGKRLKRRKVAEFETQVAGWEYETLRIDVLSKAAADFVGLLSAERRLLIATETLEMAQGVFNAVSERVDAGKVSPVERIKSQVELSKAQLAVENASRAVNAARTRLASNWGSTDPRFDDLAGDLNHTDPLPDMNAMLALVEQNPFLARWTAETARRQAEIELALAQRVPDLTVAGGVRHLNEVGSKAFVASLSVPLMVFDRNQGGIAAARLRGLQGNHLEDATRVQIRTAIVEAFQILDTSYISVHTLRDAILPSAQHAFDAAEEAFRQGKIDALSLLDAQRTLFDARRQLTDALTTYHLAVIAAERLIGTPLHTDEFIQGNDQ